MRLPLLLLVARTEPEEAHSAAFISHVAKVAFQSRCRRSFAAACARNFIT